MEQKYTVVVPSDRTPGSFRRFIMGEEALRAWLENWTRSSSRMRAQYFYVEQHNGVDEDSSHVEWPM